MIQYTLQWIAFPAVLPFLFKSINVDSTVVEIIFRLLSDLSQTLSSCVSISKLEQEIVFKNCGMSNWDWVDLDSISVSASDFYCATE